MDILKQINDLVWGNWMLVLLLGTGIYFMIRLNFCPILQLKYAIKSVGVGEKEQNMNGSVSPLSSLMTELAATIGTGNIVGVASAMMLGGPGALFWMMISGLLGMATKLVESSLAVKYRAQKKNGEQVGGPMYLAQFAFRKKCFGRVIGLFFAIFAVGASLGMGNMVQANSIAITFRDTFSVSVAKVGLCISVLTILVLLGGVKRITKVTTYLVPFMGLFYIFGCFVVLLTHITALPQAIWCIVSSALSPKAVTGGLFGNLTVQGLSSVRWGISRGVFSNEAGLGASGISAASSGMEDYIKQGYISMTGVFFDTLVMCLITGLSLSVSGVFALECNEDCNYLVVSAFCTTFGKLGEYFVCICIALFAFATIIAWGYQGERAFEFITGSEKWNIWYRFAYGLVCLAGAVCPLQTVWTLSDICNGLMVIPNLICVYRLSGGICKEIREYHF